MPTRPSEILDLAGRIRDANHGEPGFRSAASRAYYAAMHRAREVFGRAPRLPPGQPDSSHEQIIRGAVLFAREGKPGADRASEIALGLGRMRIERNSADYALHEHFSESQCRDMFIRANAVMRACEEVGSILGR